MSWQPNAPPNSGSEPDTLETARDTCYVLQNHMCCGVFKQGLNLLQQGEG